MSTPGGSGLARRREALVDLLRLSGASAATAGLALWLHGRSHRPQESQPVDLARDMRVPADPAYPSLAVAQGDDPSALVRRAVNALGGMRGDVVLVKPNMAWDRTPAQAANTNPTVVAEAVRLSLQAGARRVIVTGVSINQPRRCFERGGIAAAARAAGHASHPRGFRG